MLSAKAKGDWSTEQFVVHGNKRAPVVADKKESHKVFVEILPGGA